MTTPLDSLTKPTKFRSALIKTTNALLHRMDKTSTAAGQWCTIRRCWSSCPGLISWQTSDTTFTRPNRGHLFRQETTTTSRACVVRRWLVLQETNKTASSHACTEKEIPKKRVQMWMTTETAWLWPKPEAQACTGTAAVLSCLLKPELKPLNYLRSSHKPEWELYTMYQKQKESHLLRSSTKIKICRGQLMLTLKSIWSISRDNRWPLLLRLQQTGHLLMKFLTQHKNI